MRSVDRLLPHSLEAEKALLGAILVSPEAWAAVASVVSPEHFYRAAHATLFAAMGALSKRAVTIDLITVCEELKPDGLLDEVGGPGYISQLTDGVPRSANVAHYASIVREKARLRGLITASNETLAAAYDEQRLASDIAAEAMGVMAAASIGAHAEAATTAEAVDAYVNSVIEGVAPPFATGFRDLDEELGGGLARQDLVIIAARPSAGKTSFALGIADFVSLAHPAVFFSLEMALRPLAGRLLGWRSRVPARRLERPLGSEADYTRASGAAANLGAPRLWIHTTARTVTDMWAWCRQRKATGGLEVAVVDYLQLLVPESRGRSRQEEVAAVSRDLKAMAKDVGIVVIALSQLSRAPEGRADKRPHLSDLRDSGALEQDADVALLLFRQDMHTQDEATAGVTEVIIGKQRNGPTGIVRLRFDKELAQFTEPEARP